MNFPGTMHARVLTVHAGPGKLEYHEDWPTPASGEVLVSVGNIVVEP